MTSFLKSSVSTPEAKRSANPFLIWHRTSIKGRFWKWLKRESRIDAQLIVFTFQEHQLPKRITGIGQPGLSKTKPERLAGWWQCSPTRQTEWFCNSNEKISLPPSPTI